MISPKNITGFILAGGKSSRMGEDKGLIQFQGKPMIEYTLNVMKQCCDQVIIVSNNPEYEQFGVTVIEDQIKDKGPLAGICTALSYSQNPTNLILTCDSPFVNKGLIEALISSKKAEVTLPIYEGQLYPLTAVYQKSTLEYLQTQLDLNNLKVKDVIKMLNIHLVEVKNQSPFFTENLLENINSKKDLQHISRPTE
jgi:molybdopterin-guanine dinucleotide biosynthesis protein A